ncbi:hypothetical protein MOQ_004548 [Trypanosoma cruzi marinkellei]|uniref:Uncharacterized protein n=1 Tax=Trypanosoma cruzi marinkellei TaxID=85056 RepID=K2NRN2_TRYCR|nr:hypothetical protein MOQ_004548 [Trypanosoma cruzi marinkellei]
MSTNMSPQMKKSGVTAADLMQLQEAALRLRSQCTQREADNRRLTQKLREYEEQLFFLRANELLLRKQVSVWSSYHRLFAQPLYEARIAVERYQYEAQQSLLHEMQVERQRRSSLANAANEKRERERAALQSRLLRLQELQDEKRKKHEELEIRLRRTSEESLRAQKQASKLKDELAYCMDRLEESERERERVKRHLSEHEAALVKARRNVAVTGHFEEEIRSRDAVIAQLQRTVLELNTIMAQQLASRLEKADGESTPLQHEAEEKKLAASPQRLMNDSCDSEGRLKQSIGWLRSKMEREIKPSTPRHQTFVPRSSSAHPAPSLSSSSWMEGRCDSGDVDLQEFLSRELQAPLL